MKRADLEHIIRAAAAIANSRELIIVGSQAILGASPDPPAELTVSMEADTYPLDDPSKADLIDGSIGEKSPNTFGLLMVSVDSGTAPEWATLKWLRTIIS